MPKKTIKKSKEQAKAARTPKKYIDAQLITRAEKVAIKKQTFLIMLRESMGFYHAACEKVGIHRSTFNAWRRDDPQFLADVNEVTEMLVDVLEVKAMSLGAKGDKDMIKFILNAKGASRGYGVNKHAHVHEHTVVTDDTYSRLQDMVVEDMTDYEPPAVPQNTNITLKDE